MVYDKIGGRACDVTNISFSEAQNRRTKRMKKTLLRKKIAGFLGKTQRRKMKMTRRSPVAHQRGCYRDVAHWDRGAPRLEVARMGYVKKRANLAKREAKSSP